MGIFQRSIHPSEALKNAFSGVWEQFEESWAKVVKSERLGNRTRDPASKKLLGSILTLSQFAYGADMRVHAPTITREAKNELSEFANLEMTQLAGCPRASKCRVSMRII